MKTLALPLIQGSLAATTICPRIVHAAAHAAHADTHDQALHRLREAQQQTRELLTRLELAELEFAATHRDAEDAA